MVELQFLQQLPPAMTPKNPRFSLLVLAALLLVAAAALHSLATPAAHPAPSHSRNCASAAGGSAASCNTANN
jgi:hypothetical protein